MKDKSFSATALRTLLLTTFVLLAVLIVGGFYFVSNLLSENATELKTKSYTTVSGNLGTNEIIKLQDDVYSHQVASIKATNLVAPNKSFEDTIRQALNKYATDIGISIKEFSLTQKPSYMTTDVPVKGVESQFISVTIGNPVQFSKLFEFIRAIESNTPMIKITGISIDSVSGQNDSVSVKPIIIEVYTK